MESESRKGADAGPKVIARLTIGIAAAGRSPDDGEAEHPFAIEGRVRHEHPVCLVMSRSRRAESAVAEIKSDRAGRAVAYLLNDQTRDRAAIAAFDDGQDRGTGSR